MIEFVIALESFAPLDLLILAKKNKELAMLLGLLWNGGKFSHSYVFLVKFLHDSYENHVF